MRPEVFFIIGPPGVGKSSLSNRIQDKYNLVYMDIKTVIEEKDQNGILQKLIDDS